MPKAPVSVTLDTDNLLWLRARVAQRRRRSLSDALDEVITAARAGESRLTPTRSVVGSVTIRADDPGLSKADAYIRAQFAASLERPLVVREAAEPFERKASRARSRPSKTQRRRG